MRIISDRSRRGVTLIEIGIAVAIISLVLSGLWFVAKTVFAEVAIDNATNQIFAIARNTQALYRSRSGIDGNDATFNCLLDKSAVFPADIRAGPNVTDYSACQAVNHAWATSLSTSSITIAAYNLATGTEVAAGGSPVKSFRIRFATVPRDICIRLATRDFSSDQQQRLQAMIIRGATTGTFLASSNQLPPAVDDVIAACGTASSTVAADIDWVFSIR